VKHCHNRFIGSTWSPNIALALTCSRNRRCPVVALALSLPCTLAKWRPRRCLKDGGGQIDGHRRPALTLVLILTSPDSIRDGAWRMTAARMDGDGWTAVETETKNELEWTVGRKNSSNYIYTWIIHPIILLKTLFYNYRFTILPLITKKIWKRNYQSFFVSILEAYGHMGIWAHHFVCASLIKAFQCLYLSSRQITRREPSKFLSTIVKKISLCIYNIYF
jgi:hypothetical protein